ncbi:hypothetical protein BH20ACT19_BH20ACT19_01930 [soil metagenome]
MAIAALPTVGGSGGALSTRDLNGSGGPLTAAELAQALAGSGVTVSEVTYSGAPTAGGTFAGGDGIVGFNEGVVLSSGDVAGIVGPNREDGKTTDHARPGDASLDALVGASSTGDAAVLEFNLVPSQSTLTFRYVFSSDEYNENVTEGVAEGVNDVFAFFVNGQNCALVPGTTDPVSINTINNGNPFGNTDPASGVVAKHPALYRNNDLDDGGGAIDTEMDGLTTVLMCSANVTPGQPNRIKLAIADRGDTILDSNVLLERGSFSSTPPGDGDGDGVPDSGDACPTAPASTPDGCPRQDPPPAADGDLDGVPDSGDACPTVPADTLDGCPLPPPVLGASFNVETIRGEVFVSLPRASSAAGRLMRGPLAAQVVPGLKGRRFVPLEEVRQVPVGSLLDTRKGTVEISSARNAAGQLQSGQFLAGVFQVLQSRRRKARGLTELRLKGASFASCKKPTRAKRRRANRRRANRRRANRRARRSSTPIAAASRRIRRLRSNTRGRFRTRGRHSSATVRGTQWTTTDRCDGTLTKVTRGTVAVRDFRRKKTIVVKAGKSYLAKARR